MRALALLAAITMMHTIHALPRRDLAFRQDGNNLSNESHIFHHLDRNRKTANRDRERVHKGDAKGSGLPIVKMVSARPQRAEMAKAGVVEKRYMRGPDYSESDSGGDEDEPKPASSTTDTMPTQQQPAKSETPTGMDDH